MAGFFDVLDTLGSGISNVAGRVVDAQTQIALAKEAADNNPAKVPDKASAAPAAALSGGSMLNTSSPLFWVGVVVLLIGGVWLARKA